MSRGPGLYTDIGEKARDTLYKGYARQPPIHFRYKYVHMKSDFSFRIDNILPGFGTVFRVIMPYTSEAELQYLREYVGIKAGVGLAVNAAGRYDPILSFSSAIGTTLLSIGTDIAFDISTRMFDTISAGLGFNTPYLDASLTLDKLYTLRANVYRTVHPPTGTGIAAELVHRFSMNETSVTLGTQMEVLPYTLLKARVSTRGELGALIQQGLWQKLYVTVSGEADFGARKWIPKFGLSIALRP